MKLSVELSREDKEAIYKSLTDYMIKKNVSGMFSTEQVEAMLAVRDWNMEVFNPIEEDE